MVIDKLLRMQKAATLLGVTPQTLRNWSNEGYIETIVEKGGHRRLKWSEVKRLMPLTDPQTIAKNCLIDCRVSTTSQRENLK
jgi:predicted site-specific integrase-resolvase